MIVGYTFNHYNFTNKYYPNGDILFTIGFWTFFILFLFLVTGETLKTLDKKIEWRKKNNER